MRTTLKLVTAMLALASFASLAPPAAADCTDREILYAGGGSTEVSAYDCRYDMWYVVHLDGTTLVRGRCTFVSEVRVLGETVPGTGQYHCVPDVGTPPVDQATPEVPGVHTCLTARVLGVDLMPAGTPCISYCKPELSPYVTCWYWA